MSIRVSLREFIETGTLGGVVPGMSRAEVERRLGGPDNVGSGMWPSGVEALWWWGRIEIGFVDTDHVVYCGVQLSAPQAGEPLGAGDVEVVPDGIVGGMSLAEFEQQLREWGVEYTAHPDSLSPETGIAVDLASGPCALVNLVDDPPITRQGLEKILHSLD